MSRYNIIEWKASCPACNKEQLFEVFAYFGFLNCFYYGLGDTVNWAVHHPSPDDRRPEGGDLVTRGWAMCAACKFDFEPLIRIKNDRLVALEIDAGQADEAAEAPDT